MSVIRDDCVLQQRHILFFHVNGLGLLKRFFFFNKRQDYCHILHTLRLNRFQYTVFSAKIVTLSVMFTFDRSLTCYFLFVAGWSSCTEKGSVFLFLHVWSFYSKVRISQTKFDLLLWDVLWFGVMFIYAHVLCTVSYANKNWKYQNQLVFNWTWVASGNKNNCTSTVLQLINHNSF